MPTAPLTTNGNDGAALRAEIAELHRLARQRLTDDGYRGVELERLASRMVEAYLAGRNGFLPVRVVRS